MSRRRTALLWSAIAVLAILIAGSVLILVRPSLLIGDYYEITIKQVTFEEDGMVMFTFDDCLTYDMDVTWRLWGGHHGWRYSWHEKPPGFLRWPRKSKDQSFGFRVPARDRLLLKQGTYRIRSGESLEIGQSALPDGSPRPSEISVNPVDSLFQTRRW